MMIDWSKCPDVERDRGGVWCVKGTFIPVQAVLDNARDVDTAEDIAVEIYDLPMEIVRRILAFAHPLVRCRLCGWVHIGTPVPEPAGERCYSCKGLDLEVIDDAEFRRTVPRGVTLQAIRWPPVIGEYQTFPPELAPVSLDMQLCNGTEEGRA
jgi:uncharacterized protein (DUF433 family)